MTKRLLDIAAEIIQTQVGAAPMTATEMALSLRTVFETLQIMQKSEAAGTELAETMPQEAQPERTAPRPTTPQESIQQDKIVCLECGAEMKQLTSKHLASHGMDQKAYRKKYGFSMKSPLSAKSLTKARIKAAKKRGLPEKLRAFIEARRQEKAEHSGETGADIPSKPKQTRLRKKRTI